MSKRSVQEQFGANAAAYLSSPVHARGASLARLVELIHPQPGWKMLDVATATGHTAFAFAPFVTTVVGSDLTWPMLEVAAKQIHEKDLGNVHLASANAMDLPFAEANFDLVTCRIAAHHFHEIGRFVGEAARVLSAGGLLAIVDNIVPGTLRLGKAARRLEEVGRYVNSFEALRDPSHVRCLSLDEWQRHFYRAGFQLIHQETMRKTMAFGSWTARMKVKPADRIRLRVMLRQAPDLAKEFLAPVFQNEEITFQLTEALIIGRRLLDAPGLGG